MIKIKSSDWMKAKVTLFSVTPEQGMKIGSTERMKITEISNPLNRKLPQPESEILPSEIWRRRDTDVAFAWTRLEPIENV